VAIRLPAATVPIGTTISVQVSRVSRSHCPPGWIELPRWSSRPESRRFVSSVYRRSTATQVLLLPSA
jgi:hypothetical protein